MGLFKRLKIVKYLKYCIEAIRNYKDLRDDVKINDLKITSLANENDKLLKQYNELVDKHNEYIKTNKIDLITKYRYLCECAKDVDLSDHMHNMIRLEKEKIIEGLMYERD